MWGGPSPRMRAFTNTVMAFIHKKPEGREVPLIRSLAPSDDAPTDYCSLVDPRIRPLMYSRRLDSG
jgi:hypothetical protein